MGVCVSIVRFSRNMADTNEQNDLPTIADDLVVTKYKMAAEIVNKVLKELVEQCKPEASVRELCIVGDTKLAEETSKASKKDKKVMKGIAFPTCLSVNNVICHYSPLTSEPDTVLADGDIVKIDLGAHIDGFIAVVAHTLVVGVNKDSAQLTGRKADAMLAAHLASEAALRLVKPGNETYEVTETVPRLQKPSNVSRWRVCCPTSLNRIGSTERRQSSKTPVKPSERSRTSLSLHYTRFTV